MIKERLKEIQEKYDMWVGDYNLTPQDVEWFIEQAERVQELEEDLLELVKQNKELRKSIAFYSSESYNAHLERLLDRSEKQNKRYRELLNKVAYEDINFKQTVNMVREFLEESE